MKQEIEVILMKSSSEYTVQSLDRAIDILEVLATEKTGCGITLMAQKTGLHKSTVHRLLNSLLQRGYVEKEPGGDNYQLGMKILFLGSAILDRMDIRRIAKPFLEELSKHTREVVHLAILDAGETVYIDKVEGTDSSIRMYSQIGKRGPVHCTGVGKVLLSGLEDSEVEAILNEKGMPKYTENTISDMHAFKKHMEKVRLLGYALDEREHEEGIRCVAVPIYDRKGRIIAAISVSGPIMRFSEERVMDLIDVIIKVSRDISYQLGYN